MNPVSIHRPVPDDPVAVAPALIDALDILLAIPDAVGVGNVLLRVLFRPGQEQSPDVHSLYLKAQLPRILGTLFDIPAEVMEVEGYPRPYLDRFVGLRDLDRDVWDRVHFPQLVVVAYAIGGTRETLPPPHDRCVAFYRAAADAQREALLTYVKAYRRCRKIAERKAAAMPKPPPPPAVPDPAYLVALAEGMKGLGLDPETIIREIIERYIEGQAAGPASHVKTQSDLFER